MENNSYKEQNQIAFRMLCDLVVAYPKSWKKILNGQLKPKKQIEINAQFLINFINSIEALKDICYTIDTRVFWILHNVHSHPKCLTCGKEMIGKNVKSLKLGYQNMHCSISCGNSDPNVLKHIEDTTMQLYGVKNILQAQCIKDKIRQHNREHYGVDWYVQSDEFKTLSKLSCVKKYGVDNIAKSGIGQYHMQQTCISRYGVRNAMQCSDIRTKAQSKYFYKDKHFDSSYELVLFIYLVDHEISFEFHPKCAFEFQYNGKSHFYQPDFSVDGQYIEIKGDHFFKEDGTMQNPYDHSQDSLYEAKHQCMLDNNVQILLYEDCKPYIDYVEQKYGKGYLKQFKKKPKNGKI